MRSLTRGNHSNFLPQTVWLIILLISTMIPAQESSSPLVLTLEKAVKLGLQQNRDILIADQNRAGASAQVKEARSGVFPQITLSGQAMRYVWKPVLFMPPNTPFNPTNATRSFEIGSNNAYLMGLQFSQLLFNRKVGVALSMAQTYRDYTEQTYKATAQDITLSVKKAFYAVLLAQKLLDANRQGLEVVKANLENVQSLFNHGSAAEFELLRAEVQLANTEPMVISAENNLILAKNALKNLLAIPLEKEIELQGDFTFTDIPEEGLQQSEQRALTSNPIITQLILQESMLDKSVIVERSNYFPSLSLIGSYQWQAQDNSYDFNNYLWVKTGNIGLQLSFPLFDGFRTSARVQQATVNREKIHYTRLKVEEGLQIQIQSAELKMTEAKKRIRGQEKNIEQAQKAVSIAQIRFKSGVGTQLELLDTQVAMTRAQTNYAQAIYDYLIAKSEWEYAIGQS
jgi:outer membrane protein